MRAVNIALGLSALGWAAAGLASGPPDPVRLAVSALNGCVGVLFLARSRERRGGSLGAAAACLPSVLTAAAAMKLAPAGPAWPAAAQAVFVAGAALAIAAFAALGRSFAVLPAVRTIVARGPYRLVRHPAYLGELLMVAGCVMAAPAAWPVALAAALLLPIRIAVEERLLRGEATYRDYAQRVGWRLVPGIW